MPIVTLMPLEPIADLNTFRAALRQALDAPRTQNLDAIAAAAGFESAGSVTDWAGGRVKSFDPAKVFALERALGCDPGELSTHLGYLPLSAAGTVVAAIIASNDLSSDSRRVLLDLYRTLRREHSAHQEGQHEGGHASGHAGRANTRV